MIIPLLLRRQIVLIKFYGTFSTLCTNPYWSYNNMNMLVCFYWLCVCFFLTKAVWGAATCSASAAADNLSAPNTLEKLFLSNCWLIFQLFSLLWYLLKYFFEVTRWCFFKDTFLLSVWNIGHWQLSYRPSKLTSDRFWL